MGALADPQWVGRVRVQGADEPRLLHTYEYCSRFGGYVYHADGRLSKQNKTVTIEQQVRERNRKTPRPSQSEGQGEEKCGESEPIFTNHEGDV